MPSVHCSFRGKCFGEFVPSALALCRRLPAFRVTDPGTLASSLAQQPNRLGLEHDFWISAQLHDLLSYAHRFCLASEVALVEYIDVEGEVALDDARPGTTYAIRLNNSHPGHRQ